METTHWQAPSGDVDELSRRKLEAFAHIEAEFIIGFTFTQQVHGQRRFAAFPIADTVRYLHALYICECKDRLLSIPKTIERYEGEHCLELLRGWQEGQSADVVAFIHRKLDNQPFAEVSRRIEEVARMGDKAAARRLTSGRMVLLNRNFNLSHALDGIFALGPERLRGEVTAACARLGHTPDDISRQLGEMRSDLYSYAPSAALARRNMLLMNRLGAQLTDAVGDHPGERASRVRPPASPAAPYAEETIPGESTQVSLSWHGRRQPDQTPAASTAATLPPPPNAAEQTPSPSANQ